MKKAKRIFIFLIIVLIILLALAFYFNWFESIGLGSGFQFGKSNTTEHSQEKDSTNTKTIHILVEKENIYYDNNVDQTLSVKDLEMQLDSISDSKTEFVLIDIGATLGTYEAVEKLLQEGNWKYTEKVGLDTVKPKE